MKNEKGRNGERARAYCQNLIFYLLDEKKQMVGHWICVNTDSRSVAMALINWRLIEGFERSISRIYS